MFVHPADASVNTLWDMKRPLLRRAIRGAMRQQGIPSVIALAKDSGVSRNTIYNWEGGITSPALDELDRVAIKLDVPLSLLVDAWSGREQQKTPQPEWAGAMEERIVSEVQENREALYARLADDAATKALRLAGLLPDAPNDGTQGQPPGSGELSQGPTT